jgi:acyl-CoA dehydrogenase
MHGGVQAQARMANALDFTWPATPHGLNFFQLDRNLRRFLLRAAPAMLQRQEQILTEFGAFCGGELDAQAAYSDRIHPPVLKQEPLDPIHPRERRGHIYLNPRYEAAQQELYRRGLMAQCFDAQNPESHILPFVAQYLTCKSDVATGCPLAMTHPVTLLLAEYAPPAIRDRYLPEMLRIDGHTPIGGTWATEQHSGSDIGATRTEAALMADGTAALTGHNWFTSALGFARFLAIKTARPHGAPDGGKGLGLYLVPSHVDDRWSVPNTYNVTQLKEKIGTRGLPTGEVTLAETLAYELAPAGHGLRLMMEALGCSRVHNAMAACGMMHRALMESLCWASHRAPFGKTLLDQPMVQKRILDIQAEWLAGCALAFEASRGFDETLKNPAARPWSRIATALAKYKTAEQAVWCTRKALELVGGNGYTEDYPVARQFRDAQVLTVWEGPEQIQALELMRMLAQEDGGKAYLTKLDAIAQALPSSMPDERARLARLTSDMTAALRDYARNPKAVTAQAADEYLKTMADVMAYALLCEEGAWELQHCNDLEKILFAERFYDRTFVRNIRPGMEIPLLQREFDHIVEGRGIDPALRLAPPL